MADPVTSNISVTKVGTSVRNKKSIYTATKVTKLPGTPPEYKTEIIKYSDAKGNNPVTIGTRDSKSGKIDFNDNASSTDQKYTTSLGKTSSGQIKSIGNQVATSAEEKAALNAVAGQSNQALGSGVSNQPQGGRRGQGGRPLGDTTRRGGEGDGGASVSGAGGASALSKLGGEDQPGTRMSFPGAGGNSPLAFPEALSTTDRDVIKFNMMEYRPSGVGKGQNAGKAGTRSKGKIIGSVMLPIPAGITDSNTVDWSAGSMTAIQAAAANVALATLEKNAQAGVEEAGAALKAANTDEKRIKDALKSMIAGSATGLDKQIMQRSEGMVMNPNMEVLFNGPGLRTFGFTFKLAPRSAKEAKTVIQIIRLFKQGMAPIRSKSGFFLKAPHTFQLGYKHKGGDHPYLNKFKECALTSCSVAYTPDGNYNTFTDGVMTSYSLQLSFNELEPIYNDDYGKGPFPSAIGF